MTYTSEDILHFLSNSGMLDLATIEDAIDEMTNEKYLAMHQYRIWQGKDGLWYTYLKDEDKPRKLIKKHTLKELQSVVAKFYQNIEERVYIKDVFEEWATKKLEYGEVVKQTFDHYHTDFKRFFYGTEIAKTPIEDITELMLEDFIKRTIHDKELTAKAWGNMRTLIRGIFKLAKKKGLTTISISTFLADMELSAKSFKRRRMLDEEQVFRKTEETRIIEFVAEHETAIGLGILLAFETGLRVGELSVLKPSDIHGDMLYVTKTEIRYKDPDGHYIWEIRDSTKGRDGCRKVILTDRAQAIIRQARKINPFGEFLFMKDGKRVKSQAFTARLKTICRNLKIKERSIHKARKTYATNLINAGVDEKLIQKQMGHTMISTTRDYYYFDNHEISDAKEQIQQAMVR